MVLLFFFGSGIQLYVNVLLIPLCFTSYRDLYVLRDGTSISKGSFMQNKHLYVLIHIRTKGEVGTVKQV